MHLGESYNSVNNDIITCVCALTSSVYATGSDDKTVKLW